MTTRIQLLLKLWFILVAEVAQQALLVKNSFLILTWPAPLTWNKWGWDWNQWNSITGEVCTGPNLSTFHEQDGARLHYLWWWLSSLNILESHHPPIFLPILQTLCGGKIYQMCIANKYIDSNRTFTSRRHTTQEHNSYKFWFISSSTY